MIHLYTEINKESIWICFASLNARWRSYTKNGSNHVQWLMILRVSYKIALL
jgi:hypothetical protein